MISLSALGSFAPLGADIILLVGTLSLFASDLIMGKGKRDVLAWGATALFFITLASTFLFDISGVAWGETYITDGISLWVKRLAFLTGGLASLASLKMNSTRFDTRQVEYYVLLLFSTLGISLLSGAQDIIFLVVAFETMGIPLYILAVWDRRDPLAVEGAMKLLLAGAISSAVIGFGLSLLVGISGSTDIDVITTYVAQHPSSGILLGGAMAFAGVGFKLGVVPFHQWVPDTYQGSTAPFVSYLSVAPKIGGGVVLIRVLLPAEGALLSGVSVTMSALIILTLILGNMLALNQSNVRRLLAFSGVSHMGYALMALQTGSKLGVATLLFYFAAYAVTNIGAFVVLHVVESNSDSGDISIFNGLGKRSPGIAIAMLAFLLSLAGIPFVVGFWAKLAVFVVSWQAGHYAIVTLAALISVVGLFYYMRVARAIYMNEPTSTEPISIDLGSKLAIILCLLFVVGMGLWPSPWFSAALASVPL